MSHRDALYTLMTGLPFNGPKRRGDGPGQRSRSRAQLQLAFARSLTCCSKKSRRIKKQPKTPLSGRASSPGKCPKNTFISKTEQLWLIEDRLEKKNEAIP